MDQNTEDAVLKRSQTNCCICGITGRKIFLVISLIALLHIALWGSLVAAHLFQRNELKELRIASAKAIAECSRHAAFINAKLQQDPTNNLSTQRNISSKSPRDIKQSKQTKNVPPERANSTRTPSCPFNSKKRRKICTFVANEVSRQLNRTELRKEIKKIMDEEDRFPKVYASVLGHNDQDLRPEIDGKGMYSIMWDWTALHGCRAPRDKYPVRCRLTRKSSIQPMIKNKRFIHGMKVKVQGIYFVYSQMTFAVNDNLTNDFENVAPFISKVTILMSRPRHEHVELISQVPVLTRQGNNQKPLITVSMFTQAYLYKNSVVRVVVSLRNDYRHHLSGKKKAKLFNFLRTFNVFGMYLLKKTDDQP